MKRCYIFGGSKITNYDYINIDTTDSAMVICADSGYLHAQKLGIVPNLYIGDFDSAKEPDGENVIKLNCEKDESDMYMAIQQGINNNCDEFYIYGGLGGRFDHTFSNIQLLSRYIDENIRVKLIDDKNEIFMIKDEVIKVFPSEKKYVSIFSFSEKCEGVTLEGAKYPLDNYTLTNTYPIGLSNEIIGECETITVKKGKALIILSKD